ncbi:hypothetical protein PGT21_012170 [Puccinia graminis f. sp. tritici]|uniref:Uncharacterized protein n=1 Tax=Puccinia graminis f. sp. tritici TaxID=56615 RepID=A0A5B0NUS5_PUCGR|nr:hypothetical protein PGT21_012170 [Puccinia graminis f. sp. tritici]KAA1093823.1 hypothetical protein PGTUg99_031076 [Puccinia graminis f. sp. tritici]
MKASSSIYTSPSTSSRAYSDAANEADGMKPMRIVSTCNRFTTGVIDKEEDFVSITSPARALYEATRNPFPSHSTANARKENDKDRDPTGVTRFPFNGLQLQA